MIYYAHTANGPDGKPDPDQTHWQSMEDHLASAIFVDMTTACSSIIPRRRSQMAQTLEIPRRPAIQTGDVERF